MKKKILQDLAVAYRLINPGCVVLISVGDGDRDNLFTVTWNMPVRSNPGMMAIVSSKRHFSYEFISRTGEFGVNIPDATIAEAVLGCGRVSGRSEPDKFARFGLGRQTAQHIKAPLVEQAVANLECRVCQVVDLGTSALLIGQIVGARVATDHFKDNRWSFENGLELLHHLGGDHFGVSNRVVVPSQ